MTEEDDGDKKWYQALQKKINSNKNLQRLKEDEKYFELAQEILNNPSARSMMKLHNLIMKGKGPDETTFS